MEGKKRDGDATSLEEVGSKDCDIRVNNGSGSRFSILLVVGV